MLSYRSMPLSQAGRFLPPMLSIMAENDPDAASRIGATKKVLGTYQDKAFAVIAQDGWRVVGAAIWTSAANRVWPQNNEASLSAACGFPIANCGTLINFFVRQAYRGVGIGAELESRMFAQMRDQGQTHMMNFAYGTPGIQSFLSSRPGARILEDLLGKDGSPVIIAPLQPG